METRNTHMKYQVELARLDHNLPVTALQRNSCNIALHLIPALSELDLTSPLTPLLLVRHLGVLMGVPPPPPATFAPPAPSVSYTNHHQRRNGRGFVSRTPFDSKTTKDTSGEQLTPGTSRGTGSQASGGVEEMIHSALQ